jgi:DNA polymerase-1
VEVLVTHASLSSHLELLKTKTSLSLDTETTGLRPYHGDRLFAIIVADEHHEYFFNFNPHESFDADEILPLEALKDMAELLQQDRLWLLHNAKYDMHILAQEGLELGGTVHDCQAVERLVENDLMRGYSLAECLARRGWAKDDGAMRYLKEHELSAKVEIPGTERETTVYYFDEIPREIIVPYGCKDARGTFDLGTEQMRQILLMDADRPDQCAALANVYVNETALTKVVFHVEQFGLKIDRDYCERARIAEAERMAAAEARFEEHAGRPFIESGKVFAEIMQGVNFERTAKGNPSFDAESLPLYDHPVVPIILDRRDAKKQYDYFNGFLYHADPGGIIHAKLNQDGTVTGRFSSSEPNLQNMTKVEASELATTPWPVRRAIVPPSADFLLVMMDMDQAEYRLMLDYAGAQGLIEKVLGGLDVHQATADVSGTTRKEAKTTNFLTLYGGGVTLLAQNLGVTVERARRIREAIFEAAPEIAQFLERVINAAERRRYIVNWFGRRCRFPNSRLCYKAPNALIQGGVGDIVKIGMVRVDELLRAKKARSRLILNVHDELVFACHKDEIELMPECRRILEGVYPHRYLPLTWGIDHSFVSLADKVKGLPA